MSTLSNINKICGSLFSILVILTIIEPFPVNFCIRDGFYGFVTDSSRFVTIPRTHASDR
jgi:hypothetical protein